MTSAPLATMPDAIRRAIRFVFTDIDGPIESVIVPGFFPNNPLGHRYPALCAIGNTGAGRPLASRAPPVL